jgi:hypothetical protein
VGGISAVYLTGYPGDLFGVDVKTSSGTRRVHMACDVFSTSTGVFDVEEADGDLLRSKGIRINELLKEKAKDFTNAGPRPWHFVEVAADFAGHGYCAPKGQGMWVRAARSCTQQGDFDGTMHPNERGQAAYGLRIMQSLRKHMLPGRGPVVRR